MSYSVTGPVTHREAVSFPRFSCPHERIPSSPPRVHDFLKPLSSDRLSPSLRILDRAFRLRHSIPLIWTSFKIVQMDLPCPLPCISLKKTRGMATNSWCPLLGKAEVFSFPFLTPLFPHLWVSGCQGIDEDTFGDQTSDGVCLFLHLRNSVLTIGKNTSSTETTMTSRMAVTRNGKHWRTQRGTGWAGSLLAGPHRPGAEGRGLVLCPTPIPLGSSLKELRCGWGWEVSKVQEDPGTG